MTIIRVRITITAKATRPGLASSSRMMHASASPKTAARPLSHNQPKTKDLCDFALMMLITPPSLQFDSIIIIVAGGKSQNLGLRSHRNENRIISG
jgi:hypothetical protein